MIDFSAWYELYPRKVCKKDAELAWKKLTPDQKFVAFESLPIHVRYWAAAGTEKEYLPYPATWLRGERWQDELEMPVTQKPADEWWKSAAGIQAKGASLGIFAKPGEGYPELKARILAGLKVTT